MNARLHRALYRILASGERVLHLQHDLTNRKFKDAELASLAEDIYRLEEDSGLNTSGQVPQVGILKDGHIVAVAWAEEGGGFFSMAVSEPFRGQGLARKVLVALIALGRKEKWERLIGDAIHDASMHLMEELGFTQRSGVEWSLSLED